MSALALGLERKNLEMSDPMYAIFRRGSTQYRVEKGDVVRLQLLDAEVGSQVVLDDVFQIGDENKVVIGRPRVENAKVVGKVLRHGKDKKILVYTFKRRKGYEKRRGHRQLFTEIQVEDIQY
jgi:large subunit ribosomal protein L21